MLFVIAAIVLAGLGIFLLNLDIRRKRAQAEPEEEFYDDVEFVDESAESDDYDDDFADDHDFDVGRGNDDYRDDDDDNDEDYDDAAYAAPGVDEAAAKPVTTLPQPTSHSFTITKTPHVTQPTGSHAERAAASPASSAQRLGVDSTDDFGGAESTDQDLAAEADRGSAAADATEKTVAPPMVLPATHARLPKSAFTGLLRSATRTRRNWASERQFDYAKEDLFLSDEWAHGFASSNFTAKDVVSGVAAGYELRLVDLGQVTVMAMRRKTTSDVVIDMRRILKTDAYEFKDLVSVTAFQGFQVFSSNPGVAQRFIDKRVGVALHDMPTKVTAIWLESNWVLAATPKGSTEEDWDATITPLSLLADASYVLPPKSGAMPPVDYQDNDPTRVMPLIPAVVDEEEEDAVVPPSLPHLKPKEEPVVLPSRVREESRGSVNKHSLGVDDVSPIADGDRQNPNDYFGTRVIRDTSQGSSIFTDGKRND